MKQKLNSIIALCFFGLCFFVVIDSFAWKTVPSIYASIAGSIGLSIMAIATNYQLPKLNITISEVFVVILLLHMVLFGTHYSKSQPVWLLTLLSSVMLFGVIKRTKFHIDYFFVGLVLLGITQSLYGICQYWHIFSNYSSHFRISGSFDNPAGFAAALSVCFPFALYTLHKKEMYWKLLGGLTAVLFTIAVVLSHSRAGIIAIAIISGIWAVKVLKLNWTNNWNGRTKIISLSVVIIAVLVGLYFVKKDSADGRLLIWQCSARMIADAPLLGHGAGGFQREYMLYQAAYFRSHPVSSYTLLADIVKHPFNEYLLLLVEHGLVGGLLFGFFVYLLLREYRKNKSRESFYAMICLIGIGVFACFSYPLGYPFVRLMLVFCAAFIMRGEAKVVIIPQGIFSVLKPIMLVVSCFLIIATSKMYWDEYRWNTIAQRSLAGETKRVLPDYARLYKTMSRNGLFLYNYGSELNYIGEWNKSTVILKECANFYNDIDLQLQLADNYTQLKQYPEAEKKLILAYQMIPNRFIPLYRLMNLYKLQGKHAEARKLAQLIVTKKVKINSMDIITIQSEAKKLLREGLSVHNVH